MLFSKLCFGVTRDLARNSSTSCARTCSGLLDCSCLSELLPVLSIMPCLFSSNSYGLTSHLDLLLQPVCRYSRYSVSQQVQIQLDSQSRNNQYQNRAEFYSSSAVSQYVTSILVPIAIFICKLHISKGYYEHVQVKDIVK